MVENIWGSDLIAEFLRSTKVPYLALNPGSSYRGLHDSLVNHLGAEEPDLLVCLHEEHAVAIAHGWAKVTEQPMLVAVHSNVGMMHASMGLYNAWCDRVPMFVLGANGPLDASKRRPWIDWIHTTGDLASLVRDFVKWDDQPTSLEATLDSLGRSWDITRAYPQAPSLVVLDVEVQETKVEKRPAAPAITHGTPEDTPIASASSVERAVELLLKAAKPVILMGRTTRDEQAWTRRVQLAEALNARVITDLKLGAAFPTEHPLHVDGPGVFLGPDAKDLVKEADCVLALDWVDVAGTLRQGEASADIQVVSATLDHGLHRAKYKDHQARVAADVLLPTTADLAVEQLLAAFDKRGLVKQEVQEFEERQRVAPERQGAEEPIMLPELAHELRNVVDNETISLVRLPLGWNGADWDFRHPLDFLGSDGGGGVGSGPGMLVGAALALRDSGRIPIGILGDGDFMMGLQAFWTAANKRIPLLAIVANNRSYFNDEVHQERVARVRDRDVSRKSVAQKINDPAPDIAALAEAQGLVGFGPITRLDELATTLEQAVEAVKDGKSVVVDVVVGEGYAPAMTQSLVQK